MKFTLIADTVIEWHENPLKSKVILTEAGKREFVLRAILKEVLDCADFARLYLKSGSDHFDPEQARQDLGRFSVEREEDPISVLSVRTYIEEDMLPELLMMHNGDCVCIPGSCLKCMAEEIVGVDTIEGLGKYQADKCGTGDEPIEERIESLRVPTVATEDWHPPHIGRWNAERERALAWLIKYRVERLGRV